MRAFSAGATVLSAALGLLSCRESGPRVSNWPAKVGVSSDSLTAIYRRYLGSAPSALGGCGAHRMGVAFVSVPGHLQANGPPSDSASSVDAGILRAQVGAALTVALLAWDAVEPSRAVDTLTVKLRHPDGSSSEFNFVPQGTPAQPLRLVDSLVQPCVLAT